MLRQAQQKFDDLLNLFGRQGELGTTISAELESHINHFYDIYCTAPPNLRGIARERHMLTRFLAVSGLKMDEPDLTQIFSGSDNVFEIYGFDYKQIYRSQSFLAFQTYPLVTLMLKSNFELYEREQSYVPMLQDQLGKFLSTMKTMRLNIPPHKVWERHAPANTSYHWSMDLGLCAPVYDLSGKPTAVLISHNTSQVFRTPFIELVNHHATQ